MIFYQLIDQFKRCIEDILSTIKTISHPPELEKNIPGTKGKVFRKLRNCFDKGILLDTSNQSKSNNPSKERVIGYESERDFEVNGYSFVINKVDDKMTDYSNSFYLPSGKPPTTSITAGCTQLSYTTANSNTHNSRSNEIQKVIEKFLQQNSSNSNELDLDFLMNDKGFVDLIFPNNLK